MSVYVVIVDSEEEKVKELLESSYPNCYPHISNKKLVFVRSEDAAEQIATKIGIKGENRIKGGSGVVFKLNSTYAGFTHNSLWEWLGKDDQHV